MNDFLEITDSNEFNQSATPKNMVTALHDYQKQALTWMLHREGKLDDAGLYLKRDREGRKLNPLFEEIMLIDGRANIKIIREIKLMISYHK